MHHEQSIFFAGGAVALLSGWILFELSDPITPGEVLLAGVLWAAISLTFFTIEKLSK